jgi:5-dehydro-4-deoxyglucarate dehydratase
LASNLSDLALKIGSGLLSFPVTPFSSDGQRVDLDTFASHIQWLSSYPAAALFVAGGTGEFFSLSPDEVSLVVKTAKQVSGSTPIIAGSGYGTPLAIDLAKRAEAAGADGVLLLPQYLVTAEQEGLFDHIKRVCQSVSIGVIVYARDNCVLQPSTVARLAEACPNLIGYKDGVGDVELLTRISVTLGDRLTYIGGMPTAEVYAKGYLQAGVTTYSSAVYNFVPELALDFHRALLSGNTARVDHLLRTFYYPLIDLRNRRKGYSVSIVKAGLRVVGRDSGPVRAPITDLTDGEHDELRHIIDKGMAELRKPADLSGVLV